MTNLEKLDSIPELQRRITELEAVCKSLNQDRNKFFDQSCANLRRAVQAERELTAWCAETGAGRPEDAGAAIRNTREDLQQSERERDEWKNWAEMNRRGWASDKEARERAEVDNAALSKHIDTACHLMSLGQVERAVSYLRKAASHEHPGAALLEYVRALDGVRTEVDVVAGIERGTEETKRAAWERMWSACAAADALKGKP